MSEKEQAAIRKLAERMETMSEQQRALLVAYGAGLADGAKSAEAQRCETKS